MSFLQRSLVAALIGCAIVTATPSSARPLLHAIRVPDGAIVLDGRSDDWKFAVPSRGYVASAQDASHFDPILMRGTWTGPDDLSYRVMTAADSNYLYIIGFVRDSFLYNDGDQDIAKIPWCGDDFEVYLDANPPAARFQKLNENTEQFIFVPEHLWSSVRGTPLWGATTLAGVRATSRLTPTGYVIEVAIPKAIFPNWSAHPDMESVGFDVMVGDIDSPGLIGHDPGPKQMMFLLDAHPHFVTPAEEGTLQFDPKPAQPGEKPATTDKSLPGYTAAQSILDHWDAPGVEREANAALETTGLARKAALFLFSKRPELSPRSDALVAALKEKPPGSPMLDGRPYAMLALAERHQLPASGLFDLYAASDNPALSQAFLYALGVNGDRSIVPRLAKLYPTTQGYTQDIVAVSLAQLGDRTGVPTLKAHAASDTGPQQPFGRKCREMLQALGIADGH